ncbi:MAG: pyrimidine dimer DNA glycosylase/endonuclease V [Candidatus Aenigmatarchaeota archaeon]
MRLWSIHSKYLDRIGLIAEWREGLLAQKVLLGKTKGYKNHPQLIRFKNYEDPVLAIGTFLFHVYLEGKRRNFSFDKSKIVKFDEKLEKIIPITKGQIEYEFKLLRYKISKREGRIIKEDGKIEVKPIFYEIDGPLESWEKVKNYV